MSISKSNKILIKKPLNILGLMSGTSFDGIDISYVKTNGTSLTNIENHFYEYNSTYKEILYNILSDPEKLFNDRTLKIKLDKIVSIEHFKAIRNFKFLKEIEYVGFHGQTIYHNPNEKLSVQLGNPQLLANLIRKNVIAKFRNNDLKYNGCGAPLAPIYHKYLIKKNSFPLPCCIINIGGVSNLTFWDGKNLIGFDTGPGNGFIDNFVFINTGKFFDYNGKLAFKGHIHNETINKFIKDPFFDQSPPKSLDRNSFDYVYNEVKNLDISFYDKITTLSQITIQSIIKAIEVLPTFPKSIAYVGGGQKNNYLMSNLDRHFHKIKNCTSKLIDKIDFIESELISYLSARHVYSLPFTFPKTTGVTKPLSGGSLYHPLKKSI